MASAYRVLAPVRRRLLRLTGARTLGVRAIVVDPDGRIALVRHTYTDLWYLPGGGVDRDEGYPAALARELREELGIDHYSTERILGAYHAAGEGRDDNVLVYIVRLDEAAARAVRIADPREIAAVEWFTIGAPPPDTSPATRRRLAEYRSDSVGAGDW
ncbi:NUDIX domain-containing protein [Sphingomonas sp. SUN019]|uniref:NUDIX domain-containing protein n=1 Tax=Sphingomonas sp. SUN019 TaxID=2937788 RepID=UPI00216400D8|nr:NUDIX domain-containing protein [Sphingomonas sp. SUN019]UVO52458.1 NUDIX domain-containing protein [Sphingomonas sp. SUN019]